MNRGFSEIPNRKWDYLENSVTFNEKLNILGYEDASSLREVLTKGNTNLAQRREFLGEFLKKVESSLRGNNEETKQAALTVLNVINHPGLANEILNVRQEVAAEPMQSRSRASSQEMVEEIEQPRVEVNSAAITRIAERMKDSIIKKIQTSGSLQPFENVDYEINSLYFEPRKGTGVIYETDDLLSLSDEDPEAFNDFVAFVTHLNTLLKSEDVDKRETAETIISGLGGYQLLSDMQNM